MEYIKQIFSTHRNKVSAKQLLLVFIVPLLQHLWSNRKKMMANAGVDVGEGECLFTAGESENW